jgi:hypothetical protein
MNYVVRNGRQIAVEFLDTGVPATPTPKRRKPFKADFVKLPKFWIDQLCHARNVCTVTLAHVILHEAFKRQHVGGEIVLSAEVTGLSRWARARAVKELKELGLIETEQKGNQAVRVISIITERRREEKERTLWCV